MWISSLIATSDCSSRVGDTRPGDSESFRISGVGENFHHWDKGGEKLRLVDMTGGSSVGWQAVMGWDGKP